MSKSRVLMERQRCPDIERIIPDSVCEHLYMQHIARYEFARNFVRDMVVADIACGAGYGSYDLLINGGAKRVVGVDISEEAIDYAKEYYKADCLEFVVGDATNLSLGKEEFDTVVSFETIEHLRFYDRYLNELYRVLKPGGAAIISTPNRRFSHPNPYHLQEFSPREFHSLLSQQFSIGTLLGQCHQTFIRRARIKIKRAAPRLEDLIGAMPKSLKDTLLRDRREGTESVRAACEIGSGDVRNCAYLIAVCTKLSAELLI